MSKKIFHILIHRHRCFLKHSPHRTCPYSAVAGQDGSLADIAQFDGLFLDARQFRPHCGNGSHFEVGIDAGAHRRRENIHSTSGNGWATSRSNWTSTRQLMPPGSRLPP